MPRHLIVLYRKTKNPFEPKICVDKVFKRCNTSWTKRSEEAIVLSLNFGDVIKILHSTRQYTQKHCEQLEF